MKGRLFGVGLRFVGWGVSHCRDRLVRGQHHDGLSGSCSAGSSGLFIVKESQLKSVSQKLLATLNPASLKVILRKVDEAEVDEMWSFVGKKKEQRWLWHAVDHHTGKVLAYALGSRKDAVFLKLKSLLEPFGITRFYTDGWAAYERHLDR